MSDALKHVLDRLPDVRRSGEGWMGRCTGHDDRTPSLSVAETTEGHVLLYCHAGCETEKVVTALGLEMRDLFSARVPVNHQATRQDSLSGAPYKRYEMVDPTDGRLLAVHVRKDSAGCSKTMWWEGSDGSLGLGDLRVEDLPLYGIQDLLAAPAGSRVILVEGEKPQQALA